MARIRYKETNFRSTSLNLINQCNTILATYTGMRLTLRQLYYQLVSRNIVPNTERSYKNVGSIISDGRLAGLIDWNAIEDRVRRPNVPTQFESLSHLARAALASWRLPRWQDQDSYVEVWVEKDALSGVLEPLTDEFHVTLMVNRGYSSQSAMHESALRFIHNGKGRDCFLLYVGDHDPSGEDMVRDVADRLKMFGADVSVSKVALTMEQVEEHEPPPNPAKQTDSRFAAYEEVHGNQSWEVDALPPPVLQELVRDAIEEHLDREAYDAVIERECSLAARFEAAVGKIKST